MAFRIRGMRARHDGKRRGCCRSARVYGAGGLAESRRDDPITPRYAMSGFHITMGGFLYAAAIDARQRAGPAGMAWLLSQFIKPIKVAPDTWDVN